MRGPHSDVPEPSGAEAISSKPEEKESRDLKERKTKKVLQNEEIEKKRHTRACTCGPIERKTPSLSSLSFAFEPSLFSLCLLVCLLSLVCLPRVHPSESRTFGRLSQQVCPPLQNKIETKFLLAKSYNTFPDSWRLMLSPVSLSFPSVSLRPSAFLVLVSRHDEQRPHTNPD